MVFAYAFQGRALKMNYSVGLGDVPLASQWLRATTERKMSSEGHYLRVSSFSIETHRTSCAGCRCRFVQSDAKEINERTKKKSLQLLP